MCRDVIKNATSYLAKVTLPEECPQFDPLRPGCVICNPGMELVSRRKLIRQIERGRVSYAEKTLRRDLCENCWDMLLIPELIRNEETHREQIRADRQYYQQSDIICRLCLQAITGTEFINVGICRSCHSLDSPYLENSSWECCGRRWRTEYCPFCGSSKQAPGYTDADFKDDLRRIDMSKVEKLLMSEAFAKCEPLARVLYLLMFRLRLASGLAVWPDRPQKLHTRFLPFDRTANCEELLVQLDMAGLVMRDTLAEVVDNYGPLERLGIDDSPDIEQRVVMVKDAANDFSEAKQMLL